MPTAVLEWKHPPSLKACKHMERRVKFGHAIILWGCARLALIMLSQLVMWAMRRSSSCP